MYKGDEVSPHGTFSWVDNSSTDAWQASKSFLARFVLLSVFRSWGKNSDPIFAFPIGVIQRMTVKSTIFQDW